MEPVDHKVLDVDHELAVAVDLGLSLERLCDDKVVVALESMTVDTGVVIAALLEQTRQGYSSLGQVFDVEGDILDQCRGAERACAADGREDTRAYLPPLRSDGGVRRELGGFEKPEAVDNAQSRVDRRMELVNSVEF